MRDTPLPDIRFSCIAYYNRLPPSRVSILHTRHLCRPPYVLIFAALFHVGHYWRASAHVQSEHRALPSHFPHSSALAWLGRIEQPLKQLLRPQWSLLYFPRGFGT